MHICVPSQTHTHHLHLHFSVTGKQVLQGHTDKRRSSSIRFLWLLIQCRFVSEAETVPGGTWHLDWKPGHHGVLWDRAIGEEYQEEIYEKVGRTCKLHTQGSGSQHRPRPCWRPKVSRAKLPIFSTAKDDFQILKNGLKHETLPCYLRGILMN